MTQEAPRTTTYPEIKSGAPFKPWTEEELDQAFKPIREWDPFERLTPEGKISIDPFRDYGTTLIQKSIILDNQTVVNLALDYDAPADTTGNPYLPLPETILEVTNSFDETPKVKKFPVSIIIVPDPNSGDVELNYELRVKHPDYLPLVLHGEAHRIAGDLDSFGIKVEGEIRQLYLPGDPKLLSTMEITFEG